MVSLRKTTLNDLDHIMEWVNDPIVLEKFANFQTVTREAEAQFLQQLLKSKSDFTYTILSDGKYAGQVSINKVYWAAKNGRLAIAIHPDFRGQGIATTAIQLMIDKGFQEIGLHKLWMMLKTDNIKGLKLYYSLGFTKEATLIDEYVDPVTNQYIDMIRLFKVNPDH